MKKLTVLFVAIGLIMPVMAQKVVRDDYNSLQVLFTTGDVHIGQTVLDGETFSTLTIDGHIPSTYVGSPNLPVYSRLIEVPLCDGFKVSVTDAVYDTIGPVEHWVVPTQPSRSKSDTSVAKLVISKEVYSWNAFIGDREAFVEPVGIARDRNLARLQFSPVRYNPVSGQIIVCRQATVTVIYDNPDAEGSEELFNRYFSPAFKSGANTLNSLYPKSVSSTAPVRYLIVANSMFRGHLDTFVRWKQRKGFITDIVYTDDPAVGNTTTSIQAYLQSQYTNATAASPAPAYVLLVGDVAQLPAFTGTTSSDHVTDLYYTTWTTGDNIPDCHYGRFSAQNVSQLTPQIQKTLMYEQYTFSDPSFLDRAVMVAGIDRGYSGDNAYTYGDPAMDYAITNYINGANGWANVHYFKNNTSIVPSGVTNVSVYSNGSSNVATVRSLYNMGAGLINYTAHGGYDGWSDPNFGNTHVSQMTNNQKFGLMIGNCCLTNKFDESTCFGEALLRKDNYAGAVGYIGGSNSTLWGEDFYWTVGVRSSIGPGMSMAYNSSNLGVYDRIYHTHGEANSQWVATQGAIVMAGNMAVQASTSSNKLYYWEIYHLMGDPSVMTYFTQASVMTLTAAPTITYGTNSLTVTAAPYSYVALNDTLLHTLVAATWADASGQATLTLPNNVPVGTYELSAYAQHYQIAFRSLNIIAPSGAFPSVTAINPATPLIAGDTVSLDIIVENQGNSDASSVTMTLTSSSPELTLLNNTITIASLPTGAQQSFTTVRAAVSPTAGDLTRVNITASANWSGNSTPAESIYPQTIVAPVPVMHYSNPSPNLLPGDSTTLTLTINNQGHAAMRNWIVSCDTPTPMCALTSNGSASGNTIGAGDSACINLVIHTDSTLPQDVSIPMYITVNYATTTNGNTIVSTDTLNAIISNTFCETFEGNQFNLNGWTQGSVQWLIYDADPYQGSYCAGSSYTMGSSMTAELSISCTVNHADSISFFYKVSSEANYDKFHFYIDNTEKFNASGEVDWTRAAYPVSAGTHTFKFTYSKDYSVSNGTDRAWIDNVTLPHNIRNTAFVHQDICAGDTTEYPDHIVNPDGSVVFYTVAVHPLQHTDDTVVNYIGSAFTWNDSVYTMNGDYSQLLSDVYGCDSTVTLHLTFATEGIADGPDGVKIHLYPNPTADMLYLDNTVDEAVVYDANGRLVVSAQNTRLINLTSLPTGIYTLRLTVQAGSTACKVIKR